MITFSDLNDPRSGVFRNTMNRQKEFIEIKLPKSKMELLTDKCGLVGNIETIRNSIKADARNIVTGFFSGKNYKVDKCLCCDGKIGENGISKFDRAHCHTGSRPELLYESVEELWVDNSTPIEKGLIFRKFIEKHKDIPIYMLCNKCHTKYDKK